MFQIVKKGQKNGKLLTLRIFRYWEIFENHEKCLEMDNVHKLGRTLIQFFPLNILY